MDFIEVGYTMKPHGLDGEIKVTVEEEFEDDFLETEVVLLELKGKNTPFFIESVRGTNQFIVKFESVNSRDEALKIASKKLFLKAEDISEVEEEITDEVSIFENTIGYNLFDIETNNQAIITDILYINDQEMAVVDFNNKEIFIPLIPQWVKEMNHNEKKIVMELPIGLFDL